MKYLVNYIVFLFAVTAFVARILHPDSVRDLLGHRLSNNAHSLDLVFISMLLVGSGYLVLKQGREDWKRLAEKRRRKLQIAPKERTPTDLD